MRHIEAKCISDFCDVTSSKRIFNADYLPEGVPFYRAKEISEKHNGKELSDRLFISREKFETFKKKFGVPQDGDLLLTSIGALLGEPYVVSNDGDFYFKDGNLTWFRNFRDLRSKYLYYWLIAPQGKAQLSTAVIGSAQPAFTIAALKKMSIGVPSVPYQSKVVGVLSAYDDLIENNTRRIAILEEMAQAIYREWFVNFRFPGHENVKLVDSPLGQIPEGWEARKLGDIANVNAHSIKKGNSPENINYIDIKSVSTGRIDEVRRMPFSDAPGRARRIVQHGDVIWSTVRPNRKSYCIIIEPLPDTIASTGFAVLSSTEVPFSYLYLAVTTDEFASYLVNHATGSAYPAVNSQDFKNADLLRPRNGVLDQFHEIVGEMLLLGQRLLIKNENLRITRDLLLPKLISGQLDVENVDIDMGDPLEELEEATA